jgi:hypothetical protein
MAVRDRYCTVNVAVTVAVPPWVQVTVAVAVPGFVVEPTFHVHETSPSEAAVGVVLSPSASLVSHRSTVGKPVARATSRSPAS